MTPKFGSKEWVEREAKNYICSCLCSFHIGFAWTGEHREDCEIKRLAKFLTLALEQQRKALISEVKAIDPLEAKSHGWEFCDITQVAEDVQKHIVKILSQGKDGL